MLQTSNSMFGGIYSLVRLIFAVEERLFSLVLFPPLQVCYTLCNSLVAATRYLDVHFPYQTADSSFSISDLISSPLPIVVARCFLTLPVPSFHFRPLLGPSVVGPCMFPYLLACSVRFRRVPASSPTLQ